jgi:hypothetical protein
MSAKKNENFVGVASLFDSIQLKAWFLHYLYFIIGVEILIFLVSFVGSIGPNKGPFPWKFYFFVSFTIPIAITFLLGIFILAFNKYLFGNSLLEEDKEEVDGANSERKSYMLKMNMFLNNMRHAPFLSVMFLLILGSVVAYKIDDIMLVFLNAGEKVIKYVLISIAILLAVGLIFGIFWVIANYKLRKKHMEHHFQYKKDVMAQMGLLIMDDETVINKDGKIISEKDFKLIEMNQDDKKKFQILPPPR